MMPRTELGKFGTRLVLLDRAQSAMSVLRSLPNISYDLECIREYVTALFTRFAPFQEGDRVQITSAPDIDEQNGWHTSRHFLIVGAVGTAINVDYDNGKFGADVLLDHQTRFDRDGVEHPLLTQYTYYLTEQHIERLIASKRRSCGCIGTAP